MNTVRTGRADAPVTVVSRLLIGCERSVLPLLDESGSKSIQPMVGGMPNPPS